MGLSLGQIHRVPPVEGVHLTNIAVEVFSHVFKLLRKKSILYISRLNFAAEFESDVKNRLGFT